jgi:hypothetical protein
MPRPTLARVIALALAVAVSTALVAPALGEPAQDSQSRVTLRMIGGVKFKANRFISDTMRYAQDVVNIDSGGRLTIQDRTRQPHTLSLVKRSQVPRNARQMEGCFGKGPCDELAVDHGAINPDTGEEQDPTTPLVNKGPDGFNRPGDSVVIPPRQKATVRVTGNKDLFYICAIHPWMQGRLNVD